LVPSRWRGLGILGSSFLHVVSLPASDASTLNPEEAFVSSRSRCHVLWLMSVAVNHRPGKSFCWDCDIKRTIRVSS
jgi:hypothetical protein